MFIDIFYAAQMFVIARATKNADDEKIRNFAKANKLTDDQIALAEAIAKGIEQSSKLFFKCPGCETLHIVRNPGYVGIYMCKRCRSKLNPVPFSAMSGGEMPGLEFIIDVDIPEDVRAAAQNPNAVFGSYLLIDKLGEGAMGMVYKAFDCRDWRHVALKIIKPEFTDTLEIEAVSIASLEHKNIAKIYEFGSFKDKQFISMQFICGKPVSKLNLTREEQIKTIIDACTALYYAHKRSIIHRDIKPENIMVDLQGNVYVMDFGLARAFSKVKPAANKPDFNRKPSDSSAMRLDWRVRNPAGGSDIVGSPAYMAPEIAQRKGSSVQSDVYSLAATLYFMIAKRPPLFVTEGDDFDAVLLKIMNGVIIPIRQLVPDIPPELEAIIKMGLAANPAQRYRTPIELASDLERYSQGLPVFAYSKKTSYRIKKTLAKRKNFVAAGATVAALAIAFELHSLVSNSQSLNDEVRRIRSEEIGLVEMDSVNRAKDLVALGKRTIEMSKVYWYKKITASDETDKWRESIREGMRLEEKARSFATRSPSVSALADACIARGYEMLGDFRSAEESYRRALATDSKCADACCGLAKLLAERIVIEAVISGTKLSDAPARVVNESVENFLLANVDENRGDAVSKAFEMLVSGNIEGASAFCQTKLGTTGDEHFFLIQAIIGILKGDHQHAGSNLQNFISARPNSWEGMFWRAILNFKLNRATEAKADCELVLQTAPDFTYAAQLKEK